MRREALRSDVTTRRGGATPVFPFRLNEINGRQADAWLRPCTERADRKTSVVASEHSLGRDSRDDALRWVRADTPGKVNLTLEVLGRRADGFHELRSLVVGVGLYDTVRCALARRGSFTIACSDRALATPENLAIRAAKALARSVGSDCGMAIELTKRIPAGGGLGGGSSDAAAVLRMFNELLGRPSTLDELRVVASEIGSDVALFFGLPSAIMTGRGEMVEPVELAWRGSVVLIFPGAHIATGDVYRAWARADAVSRTICSEKAILKAKNAVEMTEALTNDLEPAVFRVSPALGELVENLSSAGYGGIRVSGSGSTLFGLFDDPDEAGHAATTIADRFSNVKTSVVAAPVGMGPFIE